MAVLALGGCEHKRDLPPVEKLALFKAVAANDVQALKSALNAGVTPDLHHPDRGYLIHEAVAHGNTQALILLIEAGADVNARKSDETGPLLVALLAGNCEAVHLLLMAGADAAERFTNAWRAAAGAEYADQSARELYQLYKRKYPVPWERQRSCWLSVEGLME